MIPDLSTVWVMAFVVLLTVLLDHLLLRPLTHVMQQREGAIRSAREMAETSRARAQGASDEFEAQVRSARAGVYRQMDETRRAAHERRAAIVAVTRGEVEQSMAEAAERIRTQVAAARVQIDRDADHMAATIVERVLGRKAS